MMNEDKTPDISELIEEKKLGLDLSDTAYYNVDDGITNEPLVPEDEESGEDEKPERRSGFILPFLLGVILSLAVVAVCVFVIGPRHFIKDSEYEYYKELDEQYGKYYEIMKFIGEDPIAEAEPEDVSDESLKQLVASIGDPYAQYYTAEEYKDFISRYMDEFVGIGVLVMQVDDKVVIKSILEDTPAEEAGLMEEDVILKVDGKEPENVDDAVSKITGEAGTKVTLTIQRGEETMDVEIKRAKIDTDSVGYSIIEGHPDIGYIAIVSFIKGTDEEFKDAVKELKSKGCDKYILDLRDNGGGLTDSSIEIADYLLPACKIMSENNKAGEETVYNSKASSEDLEMVILVNENTASASEILAAALQDNNAGTVIGTVTYGKGVTQLVHQFKDGSAIKITATEYFRPSGKTVNGVGITPDIEAEGDEVLDAALKELGE